MAARILDAAYALVSEEGADKLAIRDLAARIEYSPRTIYLYYRDKDAVLDAVRRRGYDELADALAAAAAGVAEPRDRLRLLGRAYLAFAAERPSLYALMCLRLPPVARPAAERPEAAGYCEFRSFAVLEAGVADYFAGDGGAADRVRSLCFALWGMVHGLASIALYGQDIDFGTVDVAAEYERAFDVLLPGAEKQSGRARG
jgi:AcrR family transcriptional regulator